MWLVVSAIALMSMNSLGQDFDHTHGLYDGVVKAHVVNGRVNYVVLKAEPLTWPQNA